MAHESKQFLCACEGSLIRPHLCFAIISIILDLSKTIATSVLMGTMA